MIAKSFSEIQLYNIVVDRDVGGGINGADYQAWKKCFKGWEGYDDPEGTLWVCNVSDLEHNAEFQFTKEEIKELKSKLSPVMQSMIDLGTFPVGTDYEKKFYAIYSEEEIR